MCIKMVTNIHLLVTIKCFNITSSIVKILNLPAALFQLAVRLLGASLFFHHTLPLFSFYLHCCSSLSSLLSHSFPALLSFFCICVIPTCSHHASSMTSPHLHLPSLPPLFPPILFTISLLHPRHLSSHSPYRRLPLANSPPVLLSFSFPISSLTPSSLPPSPPPLLPLFPRED